MENNNRKSIPQSQGQEKSPFIFKTEKKTSENVPLTVQKQAGSNNGQKNDKTPNPFQYTQQLSISQSQLIGHQLKEKNEKQGGLIVRPNQMNYSLSCDLFNTKSNNSNDDKLGTAATMFKLGPTQSDPEEKLKSMLGPAASGFTPSNSTHYHQSAAPRSDFPHSIHQGPSMLPMGNNYYHHPIQFGGPSAPPYFGPPPFYYPNPFYWPYMYPNPYYQVPGGLAMYPPPFIAPYPMAEHQHRGLLQRSNFIKQTSQSTLDQIIPPISANIKFSQQNEADQAAPIVETNKQVTIKKEKAVQQTQEEESKESLSDKIQHTTSEQESDHQVALHNGGKIDILRQLRKVNKTKLSNKEEDDDVGQAKQGKLIPSNLIKLGVESKCKMDVGYKKFLRCVRKALRIWFNEWCPTNESGRYKWNRHKEKFDKWYKETEKFLNQQVAQRGNACYQTGPNKTQLPPIIFSPNQIWATSMLLQPTLGKPIYAEAKKNGNTKKPQIIDEQLGEEGVLLFRGIFDKNTHEQVKKFFSDPLIINLWPGILQYFTQDLYDKSSQKDDDQNQQNLTLLTFTETNCKITKHFQELFNLELPEWWTDKYPSFEISLSQKRMRKLLDKQSKKLDNK